jgi:hypothetical protein
MIRRQGERQRSRRSRRRWVAAVVLPAVLVLVAGTGRGLAATGGWSIALSPSTIPAATATAIKGTFTNQGGPDTTRDLGCVRISIPPTFTIQSASVTSRPPKTEWSASVGLGVVTINSPSGGDRLPPDGTTSVTAAIGVVALTPGTYTWTANAYRQEDCTDGFSEPMALKVVVALDVPPVPTLPPVPPTNAPTIAPTLPPLLPTPRPTPTSAASATPVPAASSTASPGMPTPAATTGPGASSDAGEGPGGPTPAGGSAPPPPDSSDAPGASSSPGGGLALPAGPTDPSAGGNPPITLTSGFETPVGGGFEWAVPGLVLTVPGLLIVLVAIGVQLAGAAAWLPLVRRRIGAFGVGRRPGRSRTGTVVE